MSPALAIAECTRSCSATVWARTSIRAQAVSATTFAAAPPPITPALIVVPRSGSASRRTSSELVDELVDRAGALLGLESGVRARPRTLSV